MLSERFIKPASSQNISMASVNRIDEDEFYTKRHLRPSHATMLTGFYDKKIGTYWPNIPTLVIWACLILLRLMRDLGNYIAFSRINIVTTR